MAKGQDLKYVLLRLQKAVARIEEALKVSLISIKKCSKVYLTFELTAFLTETYRIEIIFIIETILNKVSL